MISDEKKFIFIHIPKTAGTSIDWELFRYCKYPPIRKDGDVFVANKNSKGYNEHDKIVDMGVNLNEYFKFTVIRNPYERLNSLYQYKNRGMDFNSWLHTDIESQLDYICIDGENKMDYMIRFEDLIAGWNEVCNNIGIKTTLEHIRKTKRKRNYIDSESIEIINNKFKKEFETLNYKMI